MSRVAHARWISRHGVPGVHDRLGALVLPELQIGVGQEIERVKSQWIRGPVSRRSGIDVSTQGIESVDGGEIGSDGVLPHAERGEYVRRHMPGVRRGWCQPRIAAGGGQPFCRDRRVVVAVNEVVRNARMIGQLSLETLEDSGSSELA